MSKVDFGRRKFAVSRRPWHALNWISIATMVGLLALLVTLFHSASHRYITAADGRQFEVIQFSRQSHGRHRWVFLQYITASSNQDSLQREIDDLLPMLGRTADSLGDQEVQITASQPIVRLKNIYSLYHSYTIWLARDGQLWHQEVDEPESSRSR